MTVAERRTGSQRGSAMVEFALIVPLYFLLIFSSVQFAIVFFGLCNASYASQVAVRYAIVHGALSAAPCTSTNLTNIANHYLWAAPAGSVTVTSTWAPDNNPGGTVTVRVAILYKTMIPFSALSTLPVGASAQGMILY